MGFLRKIDEEMRQGSITADEGKIIQDFYGSYANAVKKNGYEIAALEPLFEKYIHFIGEQIAHPYAFEIFHARITAPFDYYQFGIDLVRPLVDFTHSKVHGMPHIDAMQEALSRGENVILLSNHQIEPDPQAISLLLEKTHPKVADSMIFVAGHRVISDPMAVPLSKGVNLLCIFSKNYIENPPEHKHEKLMHNRRTMHQMVELLSAGGKCIYVAPSGGRDRPDASGQIQVSPFDPNSVEMFRLMAQQAKRPIHFHTLALATHDLQPPPKGINLQLGEKREVNFTPIHLAFGPAVDMDGCVDASLGKLEKRKARSDFLWQRVAADYAKLLD